MRFRSRRRIFKKTLKHVVDVSSVLANFSVGVNSALLLEGVDNPSTTTTTDVATGHRITRNRLFIELNVSNVNGGTMQVIDWYLIYSPQNLIGTFPDPANIGASTFKQYVFKQGMEMIGSNGSGVAKKIGTIKIPPKYARLGRSDMIYIVWKSRINLGATDSFCFKMVCKEDIN